MSDTKPEFTPEQIEQFQAYENQLADKKHAESSTSMYPTIGGGAGAALGSAVGAGQAISKIPGAITAPVKEAIAAIKTPKANVTVEGIAPTSGDKWAKAIGGPGGVNQDAAVQNRAMQRSLTPKEAAEFKVAREGIIVPNKTADILTKEAAAKAKTIPARVARGVESLGPIAPIVGKGLAVGSAGYDIGDVIDRSNKGQYGRGVVSGLGALGSAATLAPNPIVKGIGMATSVGAPMLNMYLDKLAEEHPEIFEKYGLAKGGGVDTKTMSQEIMKFNSKPKPKYTIHTLPPGLTKEQFVHLCNGGHVEY